MFLNWNRAEKRPAPGWSGSIQREDGNMKPCGGWLAWIPAVGLCAGAMQVRPVVAADAVVMHSAIALTPEQVEALTVPPERADRVEPVKKGVSGLSVNAGSRYEALAFYHAVYGASEGFLDRMGWNGDTANCLAGSVAPAYHDDVLRRINYFRAMAGLNADIAFNPTKNAKCQKAALVMSRNNSLSHTPPSNWFCWSQDAYDAASSANLSWGSYDYTGPLAIDGQVQDSGANNLPVGHRRWLLYSRAREMGNGGVRQQGGYGGSAAIWVIGDFNPAPSPPRTVAWPPAGYVPWPVAYARWSFGISGANVGSFSAASVAMTVNGTNVPVSVIDRGNVGYGDYTLVWEPQGWTMAAPESDTTYHVTIANVSGTPSSTYHYAVTVFDPGDPGPQAQLVGPATVALGETAPYVWLGVEGGTQYLVRVSRLIEAVQAEGAEPTPAPRVIDRTSGGYSLIASELAATGARSFHLAFPAFANQAFEIDVDYRPSAQSELRFKYRRRYSTTSNVIAAEISRTGGDSWQRVWQINGVCGGSCSSAAWDASWLEGTVDLSAFAGQTVRIRFAYDYGGSSFIGTGADYGVFLDDVAVTHAQEIQMPEIHAAAQLTSYAFTPAAAGDYLLSLAAQLNGYTFPFGGSLAVDVLPSTTRRLWAGEFSADGDDWSLNVSITPTNSGALPLSVERAPQVTGIWERVLGGTYDPALNRLTWPRSPSHSREFFRVVPTGD